MVEANFLTNLVDLRDWPVIKCNLSPGNFWTHFLFNRKIKTIHPGVHLPISSFALRPKPHFFLASLLAKTAGISKLVDDEAYLYQVPY